MEVIFYFFLPPEIRVSIDADYANGWLDISRRELFVSRGQAMWFCLCFFLCFLPSSFHIRCYAMRLCMRGSWFAWPQDLGGGLNGRAAVAGRIHSRDKLLAEANKLPGATATGEAPQRFPAGHTSFTLSHSHMSLAPPPSIQKIQAIY